MKRTEITVRVATSSTTPRCGAVPLPHAPAAPGDGKGVVDTPKTVKPGEKIVVEAMRAEELKRLENKLERLREVLQERDTEIEHLKYVIYLKDEQIKELQGVQKMPWHLFEKEPPQPKQLIAMAESSRVSRRWTYWATRLERDAIEFWRSMDSDVRWAPLPELLVGDEEPEVEA